MRNSLYWDDFEKRISETVDAVKNGKVPPVRRVAVFVTDACNFKCKYCNVKQSPRTMKEETFISILEKYPDAIIHITGGEPSCVKWLYPLIEKTNGHKFHLNTNGYIKPPKNIQRLKVSLDHYNKYKFEEMIGKRGAFDRVVHHIKEASKYTVTSITCTLSRQNYNTSPAFMRYCRKNFPNLYAVFFSIYKGTDERFVLKDEDVQLFWRIIKPVLMEEMDDESRALFDETATEKKRLLEGTRFPENKTNKTCYISLSERVIGPDGKESGCSHLYRDGINTLSPGTKHEKCLYGCNRRLVMFNSEVEKCLKREV